MTDAERDRKIDELYAFMQDMKAGATFPLDVDEAIRDRLGIDSIIVVDTTVSKSANSEDVSIDEAGAAVKVVLDDPDGFTGFTVNGERRFFPHYTS